MRFLLKQLRDFKVHGELGPTKNYLSNASICSIHVLLPKAGPYFCWTNTNLQESFPQGNLVQISFSKCCFQVVE